MSSICCPVLHSSIMKPALGMLTFSCESTHAARLSDRLYCSGLLSPSDSLIIRSLHQWIQQPIAAPFVHCLLDINTFYLSFNLGAHDGMRNGRWFTDLDKPAFRALVAEAPEPAIDRIDVTSNVRPGRANEKRLNA